MSLNALGMTSDAFIAQAKSALPVGHGIARDLYPYIHREGCFALDRFPIAIATAEAWRTHFSVPLLTIERCIEEDTPSGITAKVIYRTHDGHGIEAVRIPMHRGEDGRMEWTLCVSSQVGCKMGCAFCETGRMGLIRHLDASEIVAQVVTARAQLGWQPRNLVFMGMGEALDNADEVIKALHILTDRRGLGYSQERITVCTSGHAEGIARLAALGWKRLNVSISLNAADDDTRSRIMPVNRRTPLVELQRILAAYPQRRNFTLGVNYCLLPGINDRREDAVNVARFCAPLGRVLLNLIPYNPGSAPLTRHPSEDEIDTFIDWLREEGLPVRRRITKGRTIMAACGQLGDLTARRNAGRVASDQPRVSSLET